MRNPTTANFKTESQEFLIRLDWPPPVAGGWADTKVLLVIAITYITPMRWTKTWLQGHGYLIRLR
ncbi:MAG: hypothetical protein WCB15_10590 [Desulfobacterales bacterium]